MMLSPGLASHYVGFVGMGFLLAIFSIECYGNLNKLSVDSSTVALVNNSHSSIANAKSGLNYTHSHLEEAMVENEGADHSSSDARVRNVLENVKRKLQSSALTSPEILLLAEHGSFTTDIATARVPFLFPKPSSMHQQDPLSIYNVKAWRALRRMVVTRNQYSLCANGGSSTAGGGGTGGKQFYFEFVKYLNTTGVFTDVDGPDHHVDIVDRAHGSRHSLHSAMMAQSYFPPDLDIVFWEFAINDVGYLVKDPVAKRQDEKNGIILWLDQVSRIKPRPPLVVLVYLWETPFRMDSNGKVVNPVFDSHERVPAEYDFVVGHVNLAAYVEELKWGQQLSSKHLLADKHHPNALGHALVAHLLLHLMILDDDQEESPPMATPNAATASTMSTKTPFQWACGNATEEQRLIQSRVEGKSPLASFTMELPKNEIVYPGMLVYQSEINVTISFGKAAPGRKDRIKAVTLPCCKDEQMIVLVDPHRTYLPLRAIQLGIKHDPGSYVRIYLDSEDVSANLTTVAANWDCLWSFKSTAIIPNVGWIVMDRNVSTIRLCSTHPSCGRNGNLGLMSMVVY